MDGTAATIETRTTADNRIAYRIWKTSRRTVNPFTGYVILRNSELESARTRSGNDQHYFDEGTNGPSYRGPHVSSPLDCYGSVGPVSLEKHATHCGWKSRSQSSAAPDIRRQDRPVGLLDAR